MKKIKKMYFLAVRLLIALIIPLCFFNCGGSDDENEEDVVETPPVREMHIDTWTFSHFEIYGKYLIGFPTYNPSNYIIWGDDTYFLVYLFQNNKIYNAGWAYANERKLKEEERDSINLTFDVEIPSNIDRTQEYGVIALTSGNKSTLTDNKVICETDLTRGRTSYIWDYEVKKSSLAEKRINSMPLCTVEGLRVYNFTNDTITFIHRGFECAEKWYYTKGTVSITHDLKTEPKGTSTIGDVSSSARKVAPGESGYLSSYYIPTGKKLIDACLILDINGKEVKTEPISSDIEIICGAYYSMTVKWDGKKLEWVTRKEQLEQNGVGIRRRSGDCYDCFKKGELLFNKGF